MVSSTQKMALVSWVRVVLLERIALIVLTEQIVSRIFLA